MTPEELGEISATVHDAWFHVERLEHDRGRGTLIVPIFSGRRRKFWFVETARPPEEPPPPPVGMLVVRGVTSLSVEDEAGIAWYDISRLLWEPLSGELRLVANVPCEVVVRCHELDIELVGA